MQTLPLSTHPRTQASALLTVQAMGAIAVFILAGALRWTSNTSHLNERNIDYLAAISAAEAATEKVMAELNSDFARSGVATVNAKIPTYKTRVPQPSEHPTWEKYQFKNGHGADNQVSVDLVSPWNMSPLISQYQGLSGYAATYRIRADAEDLLSRHKVSGGVRQDVQVALVPIFQFAIFYNLDMEVNPGARMNITGRVHGNANIYLQPASPLTFFGDVTSASDIVFGKKPGDPVARSPSSVSFLREHDSGVTSLNLPIGTNNSPEAVRQIVEIPNNNTSPDSDLGRQQFYNLADLVIVVNSDTGIEARGGRLGSGNSVNLEWASISNFIRTGVSFYDQRERKNINTVEIDIAKFNTWNASATNALKLALNRDVNSIYVADTRQPTASTEPGIRLINGAVLPPLGLTVVTPNPLYVRGHYNANPKPAALISDSINLLSGNWSDANSTKSLSSRIPTDTTVNAAFLAGIVPTGNDSYSGGVENFPRFHEDWSGRTFTYSGSMIVLYPSKYGTAPWRGTGQPGNVYNPPNRNWSFDLNFLDPNKLPPLCPSVRAIIRGRWEVVQAGH